MSEVWKEFLRNNRSVYYVSNKGNVCRERLDKPGVRIPVRAILNQAIGYLSVCISKDNRATTFYIHRLVAEAFLGSPSRDRPYVDHIDGQKLNNNVENLRWVSRTENNRNEVTFGRKLDRQTSTRHDGLILQATRDEQTRYYFNGYDCAADLGCSHVLIYMCAKRKGSARRALGWTIDWVPMTDDNSMLAHELKKTIVRTDQDVHRKR